MKNNELNSRLKRNYESELKEYIEMLNKKGFVYNPEKDIILKYSVKHNKFIEFINIFKFPEYINKHLRNIYHIENQNLIINTVKNYMNKVQADELKEYNIYISYQENENNENLKNEYKELKKEIKNQDIQTNNMYSDPSSQAFVLNAQEVIFNPAKDFKQGFYKFNKGDKRFKKLNEQQIIKLLSDEFKTPINKFKTFEVIKSMRTVFPELMVNSDLPVRWNEHEKAVNIMKMNEKGFKRVKRITDKFI